MGVYDWYMIYEEKLWRMKQTWELQCTVSKLFLMTNSVREVNLSFHKDPWNKPSPTDHVEAGGAEMRWEIMSWFGLSWLLSLGEQPLVYQREHTFSFTLMSLPVKVGVKTWFYFQKNVQFDCVEGTNVPSETETVWSAEHIRTQCFL